MSPNPNVILDHGPGPDRDRDRSGLVSLVL